MSDDRTTIAQLKQVVEHFVAEREWQPFHTPKNLSMALAIEAAELMEHFQWLTVEQSVAVAQDEQQRGEVGEELADVVSYAVALANALGIDIAEAVQHKMAKNARKYPADQYRGRWGDADRSSR